MRFPYRLIDLTHVLDDSICHWGGDCGFSHQIHLDYADSDTAVKFRIMQFQMYAGVGTHMDSPSHCIPSGRTVDAFDVNELCWPAVVVDVSKTADANYLVGVSELIAFEQAHGDIPKHCLVMFYTGWEIHWSNAKRYKNNYQFPSISKEAASFLLEREVAGIGIDTLSPDLPSSEFVVHQLFLSQDKLILENVANLLSMPPVGGFILALPPKIRGATEAPVRLVGLVEH